jgi:catechol 2,3-dioxygenase-like lactoylglutathione lyase family enzyme
MNEHAATTPTVPPALKHGGMAIYVDDVPAALDFYRRAFGLETRFFDEALQYGDPQTGGVSKDRPFPSHSMRAITYFISFFQGSVFNGFGRSETASPRFRVTDRKSSGAAISLQTGV